MDRQIVYDGQIPLTTDLLKTNRSVLESIGYLALDLLGSGSLACGLPCGANSPANLTVIVGLGRFMSLQQADTASYGDLAPDATMILKQGVLTAPATLSCPAPTTAGFSVNYLIQAQYTETDTDSVILEYYNAANPNSPLNGPGGAGTSQNTRRQGGVTVSAKAGTAASTGTQTTPAADVGFTGLYVVTVANGQSAITSSNITTFAGAPFLTENLTQKISAATAAQLFAPITTPNDDVFKQGVNGITLNQKIFTLSVTPPNIHFLSPVVLNGVTLTPAVDYTLSGNTLTLTGSGIGSGQTLVAHSAAAVISTPNNLQLILSLPTTTVPAYANGNVPSFAGVNGVGKVFSNGADVSSQAAWSLASTSGVTASINTAANTPVAGQPIGYYQITAMSATLGSIVVEAVLGGTILTQTFTVSQVPIGLEIVSTLPVTNLFAGRQVYLTTDGNVYRYNGTAWTDGTPASAIIGQLTAGQIASIAAAQISGQLTDGQLAAISAAKLTGTITSTQIGSGTIQTGNIAAGAITTSQLAAGSVTAGDIAAGAVTTPALSAGSVGAAQIVAGSITAGQIAAGTITGTQIAADAIQTVHIAANAVTASELNAGAVTANAIAAGAVTAGKMSVSTLSSISANIGTVTAGVLENAAGSAVIDLNNAFIEFNNGTFMIVRGNGFGAAGNYLEWYGPTQSPAGNFAACTDALGIYWLKTDGTNRFGSSQQQSATTTLTGPSTTSVVIPAGKNTMTLELFGDTGFGGHGDGSSTGGGGGSGGMCKSIYSVAGHSGQTVTVTLQQGNSNPTPSTIVSGTFTITTMSAIGGTGGGIGSGGAPGNGGSASGGNVLNVPGNDAGNAGGNAKAGPGVIGQYGSGNPGGRGVVSPTTNQPGQPALAFVTFT